MTIEEINHLIEWCRRKMREEKTRYDGCRGKAYDGYKTAMLQVMSYLHCEKEKKCHDHKS